MSDDILSFGEYRRKREGEFVRCARCGRWISATSIRCDECGIHFDGEAQDFAFKRDLTKKRRLPIWVLITASALALSFILSLRR